MGKHPSFRKIGTNIESTEWITISQAALGGKKSVETIWGKREMGVSEGTQDGTRVVLKGEVVGE